MPNLKNYYGLNLAIKRYFPFNKFLINDIFSWGLNVVWLDAEFSQYKLRYYLNYWEGITDFERADLGIAFGPSIKIHRMLSFFPFFIIADFIYFVRIGIFY